MQTILILVVLCISYAQGRSESDPFATYAPDERKCIEDNNLDVHKINKAFGAISTIDEDSLQAMKFMECSWKRSSFMSENGEVAFEKLLPGISRQAMKLFEHPPSANDVFLEKVTADCKNITGSSHGETAVKIHNCINNHFVG